MIIIPQNLIIPRPKKKPATKATWAPPWALGTMGNNFSKFWDAPHGPLGPFGDDFVGIPERTPLFFKANPKNNRKYKAFRIEIAKPKGKIRCFASRSQNPWENVGFGLLCFVRAVLCRRLRATGFVWPALCGHLL